MAATYKVLAQSAPSATTATDIYTIASATQAVISTITVCNRGASTSTYRLTLGMTADAADVVTVYASTANLSFNLFGTEIA